MVIGTCMLEMNTSSLKKNHDVKTKLLKHIDDTFTLGLLKIV